MGAMAVVVGPLLIALTLAAPQTGAIALLGVASASLSATLIQIWFRAQAKRSNFRRRQTSSRIATFAEAMSSILWAGTAGLAAAGSWFAVVPGFLALCVLGGVRLVRPKPEGAA